MSLVDQLIAIYDRFITLFPAGIQWIISLAIFISVVVGVINLIRRNFIFLLLLVILIPASIPLLRSILNGILAFLRYLL